MAYSLEITEKALAEVDEALAFRAQRSMLVDVAASGAHADQE